VRSTFSRVLQRFCIRCVIFYFIAANYENEKDLKIYPGFTLLWKVSVNIRRTPNTNAKFQFFWRFGTAIPKIFRFFMSIILYPATNKKNAEKYVEGFRNEQMPEFILKSGCRNCSKTYLDHEQKDGRFPSR
jgi:hypothetical protein